jgi:uncharacterized membrane protein
VNRVAQHPVRGFIAALAAVAVLSIMDAVMKHLVLVIGIIAVSVWRSVANLLVSTILYLPRRRFWPDRKTLRIHVVRGVVVMVMAGLFFWGIGRVPLAQAIALTFIAPLIAMLLAALTLDEHVGPRSIAGAIAAFAGVVVIVLGEARASRDRRPARDRSDPGVSALLRSQHRPHAPAGARRQAARDQFFPMRDSHGLVVGGHPGSRHARLAGRSMAVDRGRLPALDRGHPALRLGLCARAGKLPRSD